MIFPDAEFGAVEDVGAGVLSSTTAVSSAAASAVALPPDTARTRAGFWSWFMIDPVVKALFYYRGSKAFRSAVGVRVGVSG